MRLAFITLSLLILLSVKGLANNRVVLHIEGKKYGNIIMKLDTFDGRLQQKTLNIPGQSDDGRTWTFEYDDSSFSNMSRATFMEIDTSSSTTIYIGFDEVAAKDTLFASNVAFNKRQSEVTLRYYKTVMLDDAITLAVNKERYGTKRVGVDHFIVGDNNDPGIFAAIEGLHYRYCFFLPGQSYDDELAQYIAFTRKYPESKFLASMFARVLNHFHSKQDIKDFYQCFSKEIHQSIYGRYVEQFLDSTHTRFEFHTFENAFLPSSSSGNIEPIIRDSTKYNLVVFSASWCQHCRAEIPLLKKIYNEYSGQLEMTYVTIDQPQYLKNWRSLLENEHIPWRSLEASNQINEIEAKYFVMGVPFCFLVAPGGEKFKVIDVRKKEDYNDLASVLKTGDSTEDSKSAVSTNGENGTNVSPIASTPKSQASLLTESGQSRSANKILYVVNGLKTKLETVRKLDKNSIESIDVLNGKDNASAYSSGDYNQVVLIKLKKRQR
jgi:thiol-disulfide isomerase/thioredoxin